MIHNSVLQSEQKNSSKDSFANLTKSRARKIYSREQFVGYFRSVRQNRIKEWKIQKAKSIKNKQIQIQKQNQNTLHKNNKNKWWVRSFQCFKYIFCCKNKDKVEKTVSVRTDDLLETIQKLREKKFKTKNKLLPPLKDSKKTLVLELEGALVFSSRQKMSGCSFSTIVEWQGSKIEIFYKTRPGLEGFLASMNKLYQVIVFTSSPKPIADAILNHIDKNGAIKHCLYRDKCLSLNQIYYLKDMRKLNRDPTKVIFVDCNVATGVMQPLNFFQISCFINQAHDLQLEKLNHFLYWLSSQKSVTPVFKNYQTFLQEILAQQGLNKQQISQYISSKLKIPDKQGESFHQLKSTFSITEMQNQKSSSQCKTPRINQITLGLQAYPVQFIQKNEYLKDTNTSQNFFNTILQQVKIKNNFQQAYKDQNPYRRKALSKTPRKALFLEQNEKKQVKKSLHYDDTNCNNSASVLARNLS